MVQKDFDEILNTLLPFAQDMLNQRGAFYPFGASMKTAGNLEPVSVYTGEEHPDSLLLVGLLKKSFCAQAKAGQIRACGICYDTLAGTNGQDSVSDAITVEMESAQTPRKCSCPIASIEADSCSKNYCACILKRLYSTRANNIERKELV